MVHSKAVTTRLWPWLEPFSGENLQTFQVVPSSQQRCARSQVEIPERDHPLKSGFVEHIPHHCLASFRIKFWREIDFWVSWQEINLWVPVTDVFGANTLYTAPPLPPRILAKSRGAFAS
jgi:hypothetical protein